MKRKSHLNVQFAACVFEIQSSAAGEIQLLPAGQFRASDGRPYDAQYWQIDDRIAAAVIARAALRTNEFVIDYEHQTLNAEYNGQPAIAAGWFKALEYRQGDGLYVTDAKWTQRASDYIDAREYRFISPVFSYLQDTGEVLEIIGAALTNTPALDGLAEVASRAAARFAHQTQHEDLRMNPEHLALLGLADDASDEAVTAALTALKTKADEASTAALTSKAGAPDPAKYVPIAVVAELQTQVAALTKKVASKEVDDLIDVALSDGRLLPAMEGWARELGATSVASLRSYIEKSTPIAALSGTQTGGQSHGGADEGALDETAMAVCRQMGVAPDDYKKHMAKA